MNNKQKAAKVMRPVYLKRIPQAAKRLQLLEKEVTPEAVRRMCKARLISFDISLDEIAQLIDFKPTPKPAIQLSLF